MLILMFACGSPPDAHDHAEPHAPGGHADHGEPHDHADNADHAHPAGTPADHAHHAGGSDHMAKMGATRDALRAELGPAYDAPVPGLDAADAERGRALYETHCASCHGAAGKGDGAAGKDLDPPAADFTDAFHSRFYSDAGRVRIIEKGSPGTAMTGFEGALDRQGILDVYAFVRKLREAPAK